MNNIFKFAPKELVLDAFICWIINFLDSENKEEKTFAENFLKFVYLVKSKEKKLVINKLKKLQTQLPPSKVDVYAHIKTQNNESIHFVFENKTFTSPHSGQLLRHIQGTQELKGEKVYVYFKIGYFFKEDIEPFELEEHKEYVSINRKMFIDFLKNNKIENDVYFMYLNYLDEIEEVEQETLGLLNSTEINQSEKKELFTDRVGCYEFIKRVNKNSYRNIRKGKNPDGSPWTQLDLGWIQDENIWKGIFWRLDWRKGQKGESTPYISLKNYKSKKEFSELDNKFFSIHRDIFSKLENEFSEITFGKTVNSAKMEREIGVIFLEGENTKDKLIDIIPKLTERFKEEVNKQNAYFIVL